MMDEVVPSGRPYMLTVGSLTLLSYDTDHTKMGIQIVYAAYYMPHVYAA